MRTIDADRLKAVLEKNFGHTGGASVLEQLIDEQPTIEPSTSCSEIPNNSDTISRQAAIDALQKCRKHCIDPFDSCHIDIQDAENQLSKVPTIQPEPQWIPVSERLPEKGGEYLVSVRWYREDDIDINVYDYDARCKEWNDGESCGQRVIAWMPLPVVYKPNK